MEPPPTLQYADDAKQSAELKSIAILQKCLIFSFIPYLTLSAVNFIATGTFGVTVTLAWGAATLVMLVFVGMLGAKLHNVFIGIVLAFLVMIPCAGPFVPLVVILNANDPLKKAGWKTGFLGAKSPIQY
jgi:hypothetical protein